MRVFELIDSRTGSVTFSGVNVTRRLRCPVCDKPDWCLRDIDRGLTICPRTVSLHRVGDAGWLHRDSAIDLEVYTRAVRSKPRYEPPPDLSRLAEKFSDHFDSARRCSADQLAASLGVSAASLELFGLGYSTQHRAWSWPMHDATRRVVGIRLRGTDGRKFAVEGSHNGLFLPTAFDEIGPLCIEEGPTSAAAVVDLGFDCIGRPSCNGAVETTVAYLYAHHRTRREIVIIGNYDDAKARPDGSAFYPGQDGAHALAAGIAPHFCVRVIFPAIGKDSRDWLRAGATHAVVNALIRNTRPWRKT